MATMTKILITGGTGQIGQWITERLCQGNSEIITLSRNNLDAENHKNLTRICADITDSNALEACLQQIEFDVCIHTASNNKRFSPMSFETNVIGTKNLLNALSQKQSHTKLIYLSTFQVYGVSSGEIDEKTLPKCSDDYSTNHLIAEKLIENWSNNSIHSAQILRLSNTYGFHHNLGNKNPRNFIFNMCENAVLHGYMKLNSRTEELRDYIHLDDVTDIILSLLDAQTDDLLFNVSSGVVLSNYQICRKIASCLSKKVGNAPKIIEQFQPKTDNDMLQFKSLRLNKYTNMVFRNRIEETIEDCLSYVFSNNPNL